MKLQLHLAHTAAAAAPGPTAAYVGMSEVFRGTLQALLAISSTNTQLNQTAPASASPAQQSQQMLPSANRINAGGTTPANTEQLDVDGIASKTPLARPLLPEAPVPQEPHAETMNAKLQSTHPSLTSTSLVASSVESRPATRQSVDHDSTQVATAPAPASPLPVAQVPDADTPLLPMLPPSAALVPPQKVATTGQGTIRRGLPVIAHAGGSVPSGSQTDGFSVRGTVEGDRQAGSGITSLQVVKAQGAGKPADSPFPSAAGSIAKARSAQGASPVSVEGQSPSPVHAAAISPHEFRSNAAVATAPVVPANLHGTSTVEAKSTTKEKAETKDVAVSLPSSTVQHHTELSPSLSGTSGSALSGSSGSGRGSDAPARIAPNGISTMQVLQNMDMSASADAIPLRADARHLDVGIQSAAYGWVEVRATAGASGRVDASLHVQSNVSAETLAVHSKDIASYAREQSIEMGQVSVGVGTGDGGRQDPRSNSPGAAREEVPAALVSSAADIEEGAYRVLDTLSLISLRA